MNVYLESFVIFVFHLPLLNCCYTCRYSRPGYVGDSEWFELEKARKEDIRRFIETWQPIRWRNRTYYWSIDHLESYAKSNDKLCSYPLQNRFQQYTFGREKPFVIAWPCREGERCCGLDCCDLQKEERDRKKDDIRTTFIVIGTPILFVVLATVLLEVEARCRLKDAAPKRPIKLFVGPPPPMPFVVYLRCGPHLSTEFNTDFREDDSGQRYTRGGARYTRPIGSYRHALAVLGRYPDGDAWLDSYGYDGEWQVAYHGTSGENIASIIRNGFDIERCERFIYGRGIYCSPDPQIALQYSTMYTCKNRRYKAILQVRVDAKLKKVVCCDDRNKGEYWIVPSASAIRPYGVCVYALTQ